MKLLECRQKKIEKNTNCKIVLQLQIVELVYFHCYLINNTCQHGFY